MRALATLRSPLVRLVAVSATLTILVLLLRDHDDSAATSRPTITATTTVVVDTTSTTTAPSTTTPAPDPAAIAPHRLDGDQLAGLPLAVIGQSLQHAPADPDPAGDPGPEVLHPTTTAAVYDAPGGRPIARLAPRQVFTPTWVPVVQRRPGWARVLLPTRPLDDGSAPTGWLYLDHTVVLSQSHHRIDIDHAHGSVTVLARLGRITTDTALREAASATKPRTFVAVTPTTTGDGWLSRIWQPLLIDADRVCTGILGAPVMPALPRVSPLGQVDGQGCVPIPDDLRGALASAGAGTIVLQR
ncbi:hypothetical protein ACFFSW_17120 [Saccharothrix longispora]|uniref:L,D-transpeptidase-like protein n=1 Tax=Saccharothrix longispora TaxID=33920 RepID=A0ABU1PSL8_9PSEU|nr:hypothetical protein [Saccharothrix longispora]MDR6593635.1 hypothetical protein [Saccharothrix longispora]